MLVSSPNPECTEMEPGKNMLKTQKPLKESKNSKGNHAKREAIPFKRGPRELVSPEKRLPNVYHQTKDGEFILSIVGGPVLALQKS